MTSTTPLLAAVMIVKNEEQHLARCLNSIRSACDEIIIVDTGSTDSTISIAESFGARVFHRAWNEDFAAARNESLEHTNAQWVLYIDADEILVNVDVPQLRTMLSRADDIAAFGLQISPMIGWLPYTDFRLWRHDPAIRFIGDIHETTMPDIRKLAAERNQILQPIPLHIQHFGYEGDQTAKHLRNLPLLERQRQQTPRKINILGQIARIHFELGNLKEAESTWREALAVIREDGEKEITDVTVFAPYADLLMSQGVDADSVITEGKQLRSEYLVLHLSAAKNHFRMGRYPEAIAEAQILLAFADDPPVDSRFAYNVNTFRLWPQHILAESLFLLGRYEEARFAFGNAITMGAPYEQVRAQIRHCEEFIDQFASATSRAQTDSIGLVDLTAATFLIPLRVDSGERLRNVIAVCEWLTTTFDTRVLVGHAEPDKIRSILPVSVEIVSIDDNPRYPFHMTRVFNNLARYVTTPVLIQYDADVFIPPDQLIHAVQQATTDNKAMVYPYTYWNSIPGDEIDQFLTSPIGSWVRCGYPRSTGDPVGGCVVRNTEGFFASGMDNEYFIGWSSEDKERKERALRLGFNVSRVEGPMFHLEHAAVRHTTDNQQFHYLGEMERTRQNSLSDAELQKEIASWPWVHKNTQQQASVVEANDLTITIPVRIDSPARLANLIVCTQSLLRTTSARIIVGSGGQNDIAAHLDPRVEVVHIEDSPDTYFHRTRILNDLARHCDTDFIANLDCDIIVPQMQWHHTLETLRNSDADLVYPYNGEMIEVPYAYFPWLEQNRIDSMPHALRVVMHSSSVGGCVVWRQQSFIDCGMENEHFISWGYEDDERLARARILGCNVHRVEGPVFHLLHPRGENSTGVHPFYESNRQELERISTMENEQLRNEVELWPWRQKTLRS